MKKNLRSMKVTPFVILALAVTVFSLSLFYPESEDAGAAELSSYEADTAGESTDDGKTHIVANVVIQDGAAQEEIQDAVDATGTFELVSDESGNDFVISENGTSLSEYRNEHFALSGIAKYMPLKEYTEDAAAFRRLAGSAIPVEEETLHLDFAAFDSENIYFVFCPVVPSDGDGN